MWKAEWTTDGYTYYGIGTTINVAIRTDVFNLNTLAFSGSWNNVNSEGLGPSSSHLINWHMMLPPELV